MIEFLTRPIVFPQWYSMMLHFTLGGYLALIAMGWFRHRKERRRLAKKWAEHNGRQALPVPDWHKEKTYEGPSATLNHD